MKTQTSKPQLGSLSLGKLNSLIVGVYFPGSPPPRAMDWPTAVQAAVAALQRDARLFGTAIATVSSKKELAECLCNWLVRSDPSTILAEIPYAQLLQLHAALTAKSIESSNIIFDSVAVTKTDSLQSVAGALQSFMIRAAKLHTQSQLAARTTTSTR